MTTHYIKLLELIAIKNISNKTFLHVNFSFEKKLDFYLEIDEFTSKSINTCVLEKETYRYRLSFNNHYDLNNQQDIGILTRTYLNHSENIPFQCSKDYINMLTAIKEIEHIDDLDKLGFVYQNLESPIKEPGDLENQDLTLSTADPSNNAVTYFGLWLLALGMVFIIGLSYYSSNFLNIFNPNAKSLAQSIELDVDSVTNQYDLSDLESLDQDGNIYDYDMVNHSENNNNNESDDLIEDILSGENTIPFLELEETLTYSIAKGNVALTFDDGPTKYSLEIVDILKEYGVGGTFFFIGQNAEEHPDYVEYVHSNGYSIGSHSSSHPNMPTLSYKKQELELVASLDLLGEITKEKIRLFRPPYGNFNKHLQNLVDENHYKLVLWNVDPEDWNTRNSERIFNDIKTSDVSGSIILLHESKAVVDALPRIIEYLQELDLEIVNLK